MPVIISVKVLRNNKDEFFKNILLHLLTGTDKKSSFWGGRPRWLSRLCIRLMTRRPRARSPSPAISFRGDWSTAIISLPLKEERHLSVSGERMCTITGYPLRGLSMPRKTVVGKTVLLDMILIVLTGPLNIKPTKVSFRVYSQRFNIEIS